MGDNEKGNDENEKSKEQCDVEAKKRSEEIVKQLKNGELENNVKIILVIGPAGAGKTSLVQLITGQNLRVGHKLNDGTPLPICVPATIDGEHYVFIDSPGFGHAASRSGEIGKQTQAMLGFFTRSLEGIHGILYVQDITVERTSPGMEEAIRFLDELARQAIRPHVTFVTTKWDIPHAARKLMRKCEGREAELIDTTWAKFRIGTASGSRYFRHGIDCVEDSQEVQEQGRKLLRSDLISWLITEILWPRRW